MKTPKPDIDTAFVEKQRQYLLRLRASLVAAAAATESDEADVKEERADRAQEFEDDAQELDALERDGNLVVRDVERLARDRFTASVRQAVGAFLYFLQGPIDARERLEAVPEALYTLSEEQAVERSPKPR